MFAGFSFLIIWQKTHFSVREPHPLSDRELLFNLMKMSEENQPLRAQESLFNNDFVIPSALFNDGVKCE